MARALIKVRGRLGSALYLSLVDSGSTYVVLPALDCKNLGLARTSRKVKLATARGVITAPLYIAESVSVVDSELDIPEVEVVAKTVAGARALLGMSFLKNFNSCFNGKQGIFTIE